MSLAVLLLVFSRKLWMLCLYLPVSLYLVGISVVFPLQVPEEENLQQPKQRRCCFSFCCILFSCSCCTLHLFFFWRDPRTFSIQEREGGTVSLSTGDALRGREDLAKLAVLTFISCFVRDDSDRLPRDPRVTSEPPCFNAWYATRLHENAGDK